MKRQKLLFIIGLVLLFSGQAWAQGGPNYKPMTLKISEDGSKYIRFITWHQFWMSYDDNDRVRNHADFRVRRSRMLAYAQVSPRFLILTHFGINNQTISGGGAQGQGATGTDGKKPQLFFHDIWTEYEVVKDYLYLGTGLHYWNGVSRLSNSSTLNFLTLDAPIFNWYVIERTDQFARQMGIYAKGKIGRLDYRVALNQPFQFGDPLTSVNSSAATHVENSNWSTQGYINYQFLDKESNKLPYFVGTYLGTKKVFNIGAGWHHHPNAMARVTQFGGEGEPTQIDREDIFLLGFDANLDMPFQGGDGGAITANTTLYVYDYGENHVRGTLLGTGTIFYTQLGYMLPKDLLGGGHKLQPYFAFDSRNLDAYEDNLVNWKLGANWFLEGHHAKITFEYSNAPVLNTADGTTTGDRNGIFRLQTHIFL